MKLTRVVVSVTGTPDDGWTVDVRPDGADAPVVPPFGIDAAKLPGASWEQWVPVVPAARRRGAGPLADALCGGDVDKTAALLNRIVDRDPDPGDVLAYGRWLFECLLGPAWPAITGLAAVAGAHGVDLALRWDPEEANLHRLIWEAMYDGTDYLARNPGLLVSITRLVPVPGAARPETITWLPRVLFAAGAPLTDPVVRPGAMFMGLLRGFEAEGLCVPSAVSEASIDKLAEECERGCPDIVHLVAHGDVHDDRPYLKLGNPGDDADEDALVQALTAGARPPLAVALSACKSGTPGDLESSISLAVALMTKGKIPIVAAMTGEVSEQACRLYTRRFVKAIHDGESIAEASAMGRRAALQNADNSADYIDWAMPALFLASSVGPDFHPVDPHSGQELLKIATGLNLMDKPVFIGSQAILSMIDSDLIQPDLSRGIGFVAIMNKDITKLGGTRLLREIGLRFLRHGHLPLLLGPYDQNTAPKSLRAVVCEILDKVLLALDELGQPPFPFTVLSADEDFALPTGATRIELSDALVAFRRRAGDLSPGRVRWRLAEDFATLARRAADAGAPFGEHTRVAVLGDEFHHWVGGLDGMLTVMENKVKNGLGTASCPVPLIVTGSLGTAGGPKLKAFTDSNSMTVRVPPFGPLAFKDAVIEFEWVLLHPLADDPIEERRFAYARARHADERAEHDFRMLKGMPTAVTRDLYLTVSPLADYGHFVKADDDKAWNTYVSRYG